MTATKQQRILDAWHNSTMTADDIADDLDISRDLVFYHLRRARAEMDPRANRRQEQSPARRRRVKIELLSRLNLHPKSIAAIVGVTTRTVAMRVKEMSNAEDSLCRKTARQEAARARLLAEKEELTAKARRLMSSRSVPQWVREIISAEAQKSGVPEHDILRDCRRGPVRKVRNRILYLVKQAKPSLSSPQIAAWFGKDHSAVLYSIACHAEDTGAPQLVGYNVKRYRRSRRSRRTPSQQQGNEQCLK